MASTSMSSQFWLARRMEYHHTAVHPADLKLDPPQSYLFIEDALIIFCALMGTICYIFCALQTYRDKKCTFAMNSICYNLGYDIFYTVAIPQGLRESSCFAIWAIGDLVVIATKLLYACEKGKRLDDAKYITIGTLVVIAILYLHSLAQPDHQITGFWHGAICFAGDGGWMIKELYFNQDFRGQSPEIWITAMLNCLAAFATYLWRYVNVPENWEFVVFPIAIMVMLLCVVEPVVGLYLYLQITLHDDNAKGRKAL